jgi:hypothetical protein
VLKVAGQTRLQDAFEFEQLAIQASALSASLYLPVLSAFASAPDIPDNARKIAAAPASLIIISIHQISDIFTVSHFCWVSNPANSVPWRRSRRADKQSDACECYSNGAAPRSPPLLRGSRRSAGET